MNKNKENLRNTFEICVKRHKFIQKSLKIIVHNRKNKNLYEKELKMISTHIKNLFNLSNNQSKFKCLHQVYGDD